jgi:hypothetical protein
MRCKLSRITQTALLAACCNLLAPSLSLAGDAAAVFTPPAHHDDPTRYEALWKNNPFVRATELAPTVDQIGKRFSLAGRGAFGETPGIIVHDRETNQREWVLAQAENPFKLELISPPDEGTELSEATATVRFGDQTGIIRYEVPPATATPAPNVNINNAGVAPGILPPSVPRTTAALPAAPAKPAPPTGLPAPPPARTILRRAPLTSP